MSDIELPPVPILDRDALLTNRGLVGRQFCDAYTRAVDEWVTKLLRRATDGDLDGLALVAVGGYGRGELAPGSDLDLLLVHGGRRDIAAVAERLWYPIWDAKMKLGHSVRTVREALSLADDDLDTATSLLTARHLVGEMGLTVDLAGRASVQWQRRAKRWLRELMGSVARRQEERGEVAFLLEPDLKEGRGGLRDVQALRWAQAARAILLSGDEPAIAHAYGVLLDARVELQRRTGRHDDVLHLEWQDDVARALGDPDADRLMARISSAARTVAWTSDETWARIASQLTGPVGRMFRRDQEVAPGLVLRDGEVHVDRDADPATDPTLALRAATVAARHHTRVDRGSLDRLSARTPAFGDPWPLGAADELVALFLEGRSAIAPLEALDQRDLVVRMLPEWAPVRSRVQRNALHRFTVDRHLIETTVNAAGLADRVRRPDLLIVAALLHDLGKGQAGDHTEVGVAMVERIAPRMGFGDDDTEVIATLVRNHLLLSDVATRRDLADERTISSVAEAVGAPLVLELLHALTEADSMATGPSVWGPWKAGLVADLVARVGHVLGGGEVHEVAWRLFPTADIQAAMAARREVVRGEADVITVVAPDFPGLFSRVAGVLALDGLDVLTADAHSDEHGMAASQFRVVAGRRDGPDWPRVVGDVERALSGRLAIDSRLSEREKAYATTSPRHGREVLVIVDNNASAGATVLEIRAPNAMGVLYRLTRALSELLLDIRHARVATLGDDVVDSFYVRTIDGSKVLDEAHLAEVERAVRHRLATPL